MALEGLHHITAITADAPRNVDFYARVLGLRLVKKTVNFDQPDVYHLYFGDERGTPGSILTFFEFPGAALGQAGDGMVHTIQWRVASDEALDFWAARLADADVATERTEDGALAFADFEGLRHELLAVAVDDAPLAAHARRHPGRARAAGLPRRARLRLAPRREHARCWRRSASPTTAAPTGRCAASERHAVLRYDAPPERRGVTSAGTVHHVAWSAADDAELEAVRAQAVAGRRPRDGDHRPPVLPLRLLPRAQRRPLRARQPRHRLRVRRAAGDARRGAQAAASVRGAPRAARAGADAADQPARGGDRVTELVHEIRPAAAEPEGALVLMHGRGADEHDLAPFLDLLDPERRLVGLTPGGPLFLPPGGRHWYVVPRVGFPDPDTFRASYELLQRDIPQLTGVPWERTILGGFSQGTVMAYALGLGAGRPTPAGIVAMSGFIPTVEGWSADLDRPGLAGVDRPRAA